MTNLIITIVGLALLVLIIAATSYYGGDIYQDGKRQADAAGIINESQQIAAAIDMFMADNPTGELANAAELIPQYLKSLPAGWELSQLTAATVPGFVSYPIPGDDTKKLSICEEVNKKLGITGPIPECTVVASNFSGCCTMP